MSRSLPITYTITIHIDPDSDKDMFVRAETNRYITVP